MERDIIACMRERTPPCREEAGREGGRQEERKVEGGREAMIRKYGEAF